MISYVERGDCSSFKRSGWELHILPLYSTHAIAISPQFSQQI